MAGFDDLKTRTRRFLAKHRRHPAMRTLHRIATFVDEAYHNDEWDMQANGETAVVRRLAPARFSTAFDVGAHVGDWTLAALQAWPRVRVHASRSRRKRSTACGNISMRPA